MCFFSSLLYDYSDPCVPMQFTFYTHNYKYSLIRPITTSVLWCACQYLYVVICWTVFFLCYELCVHPVLWIFSQGWKHSCVCVCVHMWAVLFICVCVCLQFVSVKRHNVTVQWYVCALVRELVRVCASVFACAQSMCSLTCVHLCSAVCYVGQGCLLFPKQKDFH